MKKEYLWVVEWEDGSAICTTREKCIEYIEKECERMEAQTWDIVIDDSETYFTFRVTYWNGSDGVYVATQLPVYE